MSDADARRDTSFEMRPVFKVLAGLLAVVVLLALVLTWWQGRSVGDGPLRSLSEDQVVALCTAGLPDGARPAGQPIWDDTEWAWTGRVQLSEEREAGFGCVVTGGSAATAQASVTLR